MTKRVKINRKKNRPASADKEVTGPGVYDILSLAELQKPNTLPRVHFPDSGDIEDE